MPALSAVSLQRTRRRPFGCRPVCKPECARSSVPMAMFRLTASSTKQGMHPSAIARPLGPRGSCRGCTGDWPVSPKSSPEEGKAPEACTRITPGPFVTSERKCAASGMGRTERRPPRVHRETADRMQDGTRSSSTFTTADKQRLQMYSGVAFEAPAYFANA